MRRALSLSPVLIWLAACGSSSPVVPDATIAPQPDASIADAPPDAPPPPAVCVSYPLSSHPTAGAKDAAIAELATIAPTATMDWNDDTGVLQAINGLSVPLPDCVDGADLNAIVVAFLRAHPALFQLDLDEWHVPAFYNCSVVNGFDTQTLGRKSLGGHVVAKDIFSYGFRRAAAGVVLTSVNAFYIAPASADLATRMGECDQLEDATATEIARATDLPTRVYDNCAPSGSLVYHPQSTDTVEVVAGATWSWDPTVGGVLLDATRTVGVTVAPANYTPELLNSGARCPVADPDSTDFTVGWILTLDARTGAVVNVSPGLGCVVC